MPELKPFSVKAFSKFFPKTWWLTILVALPLKFLLPGLDQLFNIIINVSLTVLGLKLATIIHERGHLITARLKEEHFNGHRHNA
jgi:hypothetical protein